MNVLTNDVFRSEQSKMRANLQEIRDALMGKEKGVIYGFHVDSSESDTSATVTYLEDAVGMTPAKMDFTSKRFKWGSWRNAFFIPRPCMLKYDGTVDYYLDPDNYDLKESGEPSDVANEAYAGNAMIEWGQNGKKIWYKIVPDAGDDTSASVYIADHQVDEDYLAWSFINNQGEMVDHFYTPAFNGTIDSAGRLRSISGKTYASFCKNKNAQQEITAAELNNPGSDKLWYTEVHADVTLINLLLILMAKSIDGQASYGTGRCGQASNESNMLSTGTMNTKGLFYGASGNAEGVKVFGMENPWGNQWRRYAGHMLVNHVHKIKMTRGRQDGTTADDYNITGDGYLVGATALSANGYIKCMSFDANTFVTKVVDGGSSSTFWADYFWQSGDTRYALRGGACGYSVGYVGPFCVALDDTPSSADWGVGAALSCKPLSREGK